MNKTYKPILTDTIQAAADLPVSRFVGFDGNLCAVDSKALGVTELPHNSGDFASVVVEGIMIVETGAGAIAVGGAVTSDATGRAIPLVGTALLNGYAQDASSGAGQFIRVVLK